MFDRIEFFKKHIARGSRVLDIGCGTGYWVRAFSQVLGASAVGVDVVNYHNTKDPFCLFDGNELPFRDSAFDVGVLIHVLHHTNNAEELLAECRRVVKSKIVVFEDMAACRLQNGVTTFNDFWANKVKKFFRASRGEHSFNSLLIPMTYNYKTYGRWFSLFKRLDLQIDEMISLPFKTMEHGIFVLSRIEDKRKSVNLSKPWSFRLGKISIRYCQKFYERKGGCVKKSSWVFLGWKWECVYKGWALPVVFGG